MGYGEAPTTSTENISAAWCVLARRSDPGRCMPGTAGADSDPAAAGEVPLATAAPPLTRRLVKCRGRAEDIRTTTQSTHEKLEHNTLRTPSRPDPFQQTQTQRRRGRYLRVRRTDGARNTCDPGTGIGSSSPTRALPAATPPGPAPLAAVAGSSANSKSYTLLQLGQV